MTVISWSDLMSRATTIDRPVRLTIGVFDGLHIGHQRLMEEVIKGHADSLPVVVTFRQNPALIFAPESFAGFILTFRQRLEKLEALGIGTLVVIDFSSDFSKLSGKDFIGLLQETLTIEKIVVGPNFRFGREREAGAFELEVMLAAAGTQVLISEPVFWKGGIVSSSRIRKTVREANFSEVGEMLAAAYRVDLRDADTICEAGGMRIARGSISQVLPDRGLYDVLCEGGGEGRPGVLRIEQGSLTLMAPHVADVTTIAFTHQERKENR
jgi:riboflavin kinase/FMN adenylyltransferase